MDDRVPPDDLARRVAALEADMRDVKAILGRLEPKIEGLDNFVRATLPHLATKAELADLRTELSAAHAYLRAELSAAHADLRAELLAANNSLRTELLTGHTSLRTELLTAHADLRTELSTRLADLPTKTYLWTVLGVPVAAIFGAVALGSVVVGH